jgi:hypothetical protein
LHSAQCLKRPEELGTTFVARRKSHISYRKTHVFEMALEATTIFQLIVLLTWACLSTTSEKLKHPIFSKALLSQDLLEELLSDASTMFAPGLYQVLQSATPPPVAFFKSLRTEVEERWGIYALVLEKADHRSKIYIGSQNLRIS